jgi:hypothetical protein
MSKGYIPRNDGEFDKFFKVIVQYVGDKIAKTPVQWTHIPSDAMTTLTTAYASWYDAC